MLKGGFPILDAVNFLPRFDENILGHTEPAKAAMRPLRATNGSLVAVPDDDEKINITVVMRISPSMRAEKPDFLGL